MKSKIEETLMLHIRGLKLPTPEREFRFHPVRKWRFDFAYPDLMLAIECDGGTWSGGRHTRGAGYENDCEKLNEAGLLGWTVLRFTGKMVKDGRAIQMIERALKRRESPMRKAG